MTSLYSFLRAELIGWLHSLEQFGPYGLPRLSNGRLTTGAGFTMSEKTSSEC